MAGWLVPSLESSTEVAGAGSGANCKCEWLIDTVDPLSRFDTQTVDAALDRQDGIAEVRV